MTRACFLKLPGKSGDGEISFEPEGSAKDCFQNSKRQQIALIVSLLLNVLLVVAVFVRLMRCDRFVHFAADGNSTVGNGEELSPNAVCTSCEARGIEPGTTELAADQRVVELSGRVSLCCHDYAESWQYLDTLTTAIGTSGTKRTARSVSNSSYYTPSAHLYLKPGPQKGPGLLWTERVGWGLAHVGGGVLYREQWGLLRVPRRGLYAVYSGVTFKNREDRASDLRILHSLRRYHSQLGPGGYDGGPDDGENGPGYGYQLMLMRKATLPRQAETFSFSFLWGVLYLREEDEIRVAVSNASYVYDFWASSYFGILQISQ